MMTLAADEFIHHFLAARIRHQPQKTRRNRGFFAHVK
jgi:hypothetical protein